jgi:16S rRNA (cytidine1402-2'-O)-methyltransferase
VSGIHGSEPGARVFFLYVVCSMDMYGKLSIVATPIGNLEDITLRALRVLQTCDVVACEDTRVTAKLLHHFSISTPCLSYHEHSGEAKHEKIADLLTDGKHVALVSDAGTPAISDPGARLVAYVRMRLPDVVIVAVPGVSAVTTALSVSGMSADTFTFLGFPPHKKGRKTFFERLAIQTGLMVFYESPHRILKALESLVLVAPEATVCVCRELTKLHEEVVQGIPEEILAHYTEHSDRVRGEFVVIVQGVHT